MLIFAIEEKRPKTSSTEFKLFLYKTPVTIRGSLSGSHSERYLLKNTPIPGKWFTRNVKGLLQSTSFTWHNSVSETLITALFSLHLKKPNTNKTKPHPNPQSTTASRIFQDFARASHMVTFSLNPNKTYTKFPKTHKTISTTSKLPTKNILNKKPSKTAKSPSHTYNALHTVSLTIKTR